MIEVNVSPSLHSNSKLDEAIKGHLVADVFNTIGLTPFKPKPTPPITSDDRQANAKILMRSEMSNKEILQNLSRYHRHLVLKTEYERQRMGRLARLIPAPGAWKKYKRSSLIYNTGGLCKCTFVADYQRTPVGIYKLLNSI